MRMLETKILTKVGRSVVNKKKTTERSTHKFIFPSLRFVFSDRPLNMLRSHLPKVGLHAFCFFVLPWSYVTSYPRISRVVMRSAFANAEARRSDQQNKMSETKKCLSLRFGRFGVRDTFGSPKRCFRRPPKSSQSRR